MVQWHETFSADLPVVIVLRQTRFPDLLYNLEDLYLEQSRARVYSVLILFQARGVNAWVL